MDTPVLIAAAIFFAVALVLVITFFKSLKGVFALILNTAAGWAGLYIFNFLSAYIGFSIGINIASAAIVGVLGVPGLILLIILKLIYK